MASSRTARVATWVAAAAGWSVIGLGMRGILRDSSATRPGDLARWFTGLLLVHDILLVPVVLAIGWLLGRLLPPKAVVPARLGLASSAVVVALAFPLVRGYGRRASNPTLLPLPYGRNLAIALLLVWTAVVLVVVVRATWARR